MKKKLKIAIYSGAVPSTTFIERLISGLANRGNEIFLFGVQKGRVLSDDTIHIYTYRDTKFSKLIQLLKYSFLLTLFKPKDKKVLDSIIMSMKGNAKLLKVKYYPVLYHQPDIFHLQWAKSVADWVWVKRFGIKLVLSLRGAHINYSPIANKKLAKIYRTEFSKVDRFHAVSKAIAKETTKYGVELSKIDVIYSGLDLSLISYFEKKFKSNPLSIISVGRSHWKKGYVYALDAMALLKSKGVNFTYTIVGIDNEEELLFQRSQLNLENEVTFLSHLPFESVKHEIRKADVLLLSSIEEGVANVVLEAMAIGTLIISTACGGMTEVVLNGKNGFLVPVRNSDAMALVLENVIHLSSSEYLKITDNARKTIEKQHNIVDTIKSMMALYGHVLRD